MKNPERQLGAEVGQLMFWQLAGLGIVGGRALVVVASDGTLTAHGESWDPDRELVAPGIAHPGAGVYEITYPATAPDENGTQIVIALVGAIVTPIGSTARHPTYDIDANGHKITFRTFDAAGGAANAGFTALVF